MTLVASVVTSHGRTTPVAWETIDKDELTGHRLAAEERIVALLKDSLPPTCTKVGHHSRSGIRRWRTLGDAITKRGFDFVIRIKGDILVTNSNGQQYAAADWISPTGSTKTMKDVKVTAQMLPVATFVTVQKPLMKEPWLLVSSLKDVSGPAVGESLRSAIHHRRILSGPEGPAIRAWA